MQDWHYIIILIAIIWVVFKLRKQAGQRKVINTRVRVLYQDHNPDFEQLLPVTGTVSRQVQINSTVFFVIDLDAGIEYEDRPYHALLVREKVAGQIPGYERRVEVRVLLPLVELNKARYEVDEFEQVCWAVVDPIED
jgi:hypothetical protein